MADEWEASGMTDYFLLYEDANEINTSVYQIKTFVVSKVAHPED